MELKQTKDLSVQDASQQMHKFTIEELEKIVLNLYFYGRYIKLKKLENDYLLYKMNNERLLCHLTKKEDTIISEIHLRSDFIREKGLYNDFAYHREVGNLMSYKRRI